MDRFVTGGPLKGVILCGISLAALSSNHTHYNLHCTRIALRRFKFCFIFYCHDDNPLCLVNPLVRIQSLTTQHNGNREQRKHIPRYVFLIYVGEPMHKEKESGKSKKKKRCCTFEREWVAVGAGENRFRCTLDGRGDARRT